MNWFLFFHTMRDDGGAVRTAEPAHVEYWQSRGLPHYLGGPFGDRTGGLITFAADSLEAAAAIVERDPFMVEGLVSEHWLKEWMPESATRPS